MEVRTIGELRSLSTKALGPWGGLAVHYVREGLRRGRAVLHFELVWELRIYEGRGFLIDIIEIKNRDKKSHSFSTISQKADRILRKKGYVFFDE